MFLEFFSVIFFFGSSTPKYAIFEHIALQEPLCSEQVLAKFQNLNSFRILI